MNKSFWSIGVMGLLALIAMSVFAYMGTSMYIDTDAVKYMKMAIKVEEKFKVKNTRMRTKKRGMLMEITLTYETDKYLSFDEPMVTKEMQEVADYALTTLSKQERERVRLLTIEREEVTGGGCFLDRTENSMTVNPREKKPSPEDEEDEEYLEEEPMEEEPLEEDEEPFEDELPPEEE